MSNHDQHNAELNQDSAESDDRVESDDDQADRIDNTADEPLADDVVAGSPTSTTKQVHDERRREQRKIDDFKKDRDPLRERRS